MGRPGDGIFFSIWWHEWALPLCIGANKYTDQFERTGYSGITEDVMEKHFYISIQVLCFKVTYNKFLGECVLPPMHPNCRCAIETRNGYEWEG